MVLVEKALALLKLEYVAMSVLFSVLQISN